MISLRASDANLGAFLAVGLTFLFILFTALLFATLLGHNLTRDYLFSA